MKHIKTIGYFLLLTLFYLSQSSCKKEQDIFDAFPISINVKDSLGFNKISWTKINSTDFIEYIVVRSSTDSIPNFSQLGSNNIIFSRISDAKVTETVDFTSSSTFTKTYYRVFARLQNRTISSPNIILNGDLISTTINSPYEFFPVDNSTSQYFISTNSNQIFLYDIDKEAILAQNLQMPHFQLRLTTVSDKGNNTQLVAWNIFTRRIYFLDAKTLAIKKALDVNYSIYSAAGTDDGFLVLYTDSYNSEFKTIRLSDYSVATELAKPSNYSFYSSAILTKTPNKKEFVIHDGNSSYPNIYKMTYDEAGNMTAGGRIGQVNGGSSYTYFRFSSTGKMAIINGSLYDSNLNLPSPIGSITFNSINIPTFSNNETRLFVPTNNSFSTRINVEEYSLPDFKIVKTINTKMLNNFIKILPYKTGFVIFGIASNNVGNSITVFQKII